MEYESHLSPCFDVGQTFHFILCYKQLTLALFILFDMMLCINYFHSAFAKKKKERKKETMRFNPALKKKKKHLSKHCFWL